MTDDSIRCLVDPPARGAHNMAVDEALMDAAREGAVTLRFYAWSPPCLSLGRNQAARERYDLDAVRDRGLDVVRRPTGGRALLHHRELTYSVTAPAGRWGGLRSAYRRINRALLRGLSELGADVREAERAERTPGPSSRACFRDPLPGEIVSAGRKLVGSAQWRDRGALLQHGSILLHDDQDVVERLRTDATRREEGDGPGPATDGERAGRADSRTPGADRGPAGGADGSPQGVRAAALSDVLDEVPPTGWLVEALRAGFREVLDRPVRDGERTRAEDRRAKVLEARYLGEAWTWRR